MGKRKSKNLGPKKSVAIEKLELIDQKRKAKIASFPKALEPKIRVKSELDEELMKIFQHVQITIPLVSAIKYISTYIKFLKNLCSP